MSDKSSIEWTDAVLPCLEPPCRITHGVMPTSEPPWASLLIEHEKLRTAAAFANHLWIGLTEAAKIGARSMLGVVRGLRDDLQVFRRVIQLVLIAVVDNFTTAKRSAKHLGRHEPMLVDIPARVRHWISGNLNEPVAAACQRAASTPVRILIASLVNGHESSIANGTELR